MKISELVERARARKVKVFGNVDDERAASIAAAVLGEIARELEKASAGRVAIQGFGRFLIKAPGAKADAQAQAGGKAPEQRKKRVLFRPVRPSLQKLARKKAKAQRKAAGGEGE